MHVPSLPGCIAGVECVDLPDFENVADLLFAEVPIEPINLPDLLQKGL